VKFFKYLGKVKAKQPKKIKNKNNKSKNKTHTCFERDILDRID